MRNRVPAAGGRDIELGSTGHGSDDRASAATPNVEGRMKDAASSEEEELVELGRVDRQGNTPLNRYAGRSIEVDLSTFQRYFSGDAAIRAAQEGAAEGPQQAAAVCWGLLCSCPADGPNRSLLGLPMLHPSSCLYRRWALMMMLLDVSYTALVLPVLLAFGLIRAFNAAYVLEVVVGALFAADVLVNLHVGYVVRHHQHTKLIMHGQQVAWYYMRRGTFWLDLLAALPWLLELAYFHQRGMSLAWYVDLLLALRLLRLLRLLLSLRSLFMGSFLAGFLSSSSFTVQNAYILAMTYTAGMLLHLLACIWLYVARVHGYVDTWIGNVGGKDLSGAPRPRQFLAAFYFVTTTVTTVGYGDITPTNDAEQAVALFTMLAGVLFLSFVISTLIELLASAGDESRRAHRYIKKMQMVDGWLSSVRLPRHLSRRIYRFYGDVWVRQKDEQELWSQALRDLPHALRAEVNWELLRNVFERLQAFHGLSLYSLKRLASRLEPCKLGPDQDLYSLGDEADCIWLLSDGTVELLRYGRVQGLVPAPEVLGVASALRMLDRSSGPGIRQLTVRTLTPCTAWRLPVRQLRTLLHKHPQLRSSLLDMYRRNSLCEQVTAALQCSQPSAPASPGSGGDEGDAAGAGAGSQQHGQRQHGRLQLQHLRDPTELPDGSDAGSSSSSSSSLSSSTSQVGDDDGGTDQGDARAAPSQREQLQQQGMMFRHLHTPMPFQNTRISAALR